jgi:hypothetical protein
LLAQLQLGKVHFIPVLVYFFDVDALCLVLVQEVQRVAVNAHLLCLLSLGLHRSIGTVQHVVEVVKLDLDFLKINVFGAFVARVHLHVHVLLELLLDFFFMLELLLEQSGVALANHEVEVAQQIVLDVLHVLADLGRLQIVPLVEVDDVLDVALAHLQNEVGLLILLVVQVVHADEVFDLHLQVLLRELVAQLSDSVNRVFLDVDYRPQGFNSFFNEPDDVLRLQLILELLSYEQLVQLDLVG